MSRSVEFHLSSSLWQNTINLYFKLDRKNEETTSLPVSREHPVVQPSRSLEWKIIDLISRSTIDNSGMWPTLRSTRGPAKREQKLTQTRDEAVLVHESVPVCRRPSLARESGVRSTKRLLVKDGAYSQANLEEGS